MTFDGDVRVVNSEDGGEITFEHGQPLMDEGLETAVYLSLFSSPGWWGNSLSTQGEQLGCTLEDLRNGTLSNKVRLDAEETCRKALAWLVSEGVADSVTIVASIPRADLLGLVITIKQPATGQATLRYAVNWKAQRVRAGVGG